MSSTIAFNTTVFFLLLGLVGIVVVYLIARRPSRTSAPPVAATSDYERVERPAMPRELQTARLVMNERLIKSVIGLRMGARLDQLFQLESGMLVLVETKTRRYARVRRRDQVQLTVQSYILMRAGIPELAGKTIAPYGYVRCVSPGRPPQYVRTPILIDDVPEELYERRQGLAKGDATPWVSDTPARCARCHVNARCPVWADRTHTPLMAWWTPAQRAWVELTRGWADTSPLIGRRAPLPGQPRPRQAAQKGQR